jgi:hypothetical protein
VLLLLLGLGSSRFSCGIFFHLARYLTTSI